MVFRAPKWLRKIFDFKIETGIDIKENKSWDKKFHIIIKNFDNFAEFIEEKYNHLLNSRYLWRSNLTKIKKALKGNFEIFNEFEEWEKKREQKRKLQQKIRKELSVIYNKILNDFKQSPFKYKWVTANKNGYNGVVYTFNNNEKVEYYYNGILIINGIKYTMSLSYESKFVLLFSKIITKSKDGKNYKDKNLKIIKLEKSISLRKKQIKRIPDNDPMKESLINELKNYERILKKIKNKKT